MGTESEAERNLTALRKLYGEWRTEISTSGLRDRPVVTHVFQKPLVEELGLKVVGVFGPAPLEATQIRTLAERSPALIVDNVHNPIAGPLAEAVPEADVVVFRNFPGSKRERDLVDVLKANRLALEKLE